MQPESQISGLESWSYLFDLPCFIQPCSFAFVFHDFILIMILALFVLIVMDFSLYLYFVFLMRNNKNVILFYQKQSTQNKS